MQRFFVNFHWSTFIARCLGFLAFQQKLFVVENDEICVSDNLYCVFDVKILEPVCIFVFAVS